MMKKRTVLITGGAKRVGKEIALSLANKDTNLIIHYNKSLLEAKKLASTMATMLDDHYS